MSCCNFQHFLTVLLVFENFFQNLEMTSKKKSFLKKIILIVQLKNVYNASCLLLCCCSFFVPLALDVVSVISALGVVNLKLSAVISY